MPITDSRPTTSAPPPRLATTARSKPRSGRWSALIALAAVALLAPDSLARQATRADIQMIVTPVRSRPGPGTTQPVRITAASAIVSITDQVASTTLELSLTNPAGRPQEAQLIVPVPDGVTVRSLQYDGTGPEPTATLLPKDEARRAYNAIVNSMRDPALLEFVGFNLIKTSVFPVPAGATQKVRIVYEHLLIADGDRVDYVLPRSDSLEDSGVAWSLQVEVKSARAIATVYSPSHTLVIDRRGSGAVGVSVAGAAANEPGSFRVSYLMQRESGLSASFIAYPDTNPSTGGYVMLLAGMPELKQGDQKLRREVVLVIDRSGSMQGAKIEQARAAALQVLEGIEDGEAFNIIDYSDSIASFAPKPVVKSSEAMTAARSYIKSIKAAGGTNIRDALLEALKPTATPGTLPMVLFLTDGLPTVGERNEVAIRDSVKAANVGGRRVFSFGVGVDVNAPLLTAIARGARGTSTFVLPEENVESKVSQVFARLSGPVLAGPKMTVLDERGAVSTRLLRDPQPSEIPDLFEGEQFVMLARYDGAEPRRVKLDGNYLGAARSFEFTFDPAAASIRNGFVARLWATRRIGSLIEQVRAMGAAGTSATSDPRFKELTDEIVKLSTTFGVLTEYTAFLAVEPGMVAGGAVPAAIADRDRLLSEQLESKAISVRSGLDGVSQEANVNVQRELAVAPARQSYFGKDMKKVFVGGVQSANADAVVCRGARWVDSRILAQENDPPEVTVEFGTHEFDTVLNQLVSEGRQGVLSRGGEIYLLVSGKRTLVKLPA